MTYDSRIDTYQHIADVRDLLDRVVEELLYRGRAHDESKLKSPERQMFDEYVPKLRETTYGSEEYKRYTSEMGEALLHHYGHNPHHPEHYADGIRGMSLVDLIEMLCDWVAATKRHADGDIYRSLKLNQERFGYSDELAAILENTLRELLTGPL